jgi:N-acyl-D-aspartate/D-glutamate deacylase
MGLIAAHGHTVIMTAGGRSEADLRTVLGYPATGVVAAGLLADLVVLDTERLADRATFTRPRRFPGGVDLVLVAGTAVVTGEEHTGATPGTVVRRAER